jgi:uncharacterized protein with HEPN domain
MPSDRPAQRLQDIVDAADEIANFINGIETYAEFKKDRRTVRAVERCLLIISEAAKKLGDSAPLFAPEQPWTDIRGIGNHLRHEYDQIRESIIWKTIRDDIPPLRQACFSALQRLEP